MGVLVASAMLSSGVGCGGTPATDAGMTDGGNVPVDAPSGGDASDECLGARAITLAVGTQQITGDTTGRPVAGPVSCPDGAAASPQELLAFTLPGTGMVGVAFDTDSASTELDTTVVVRPGHCGNTTDELCFDDAIPGFVDASYGAFTGMGGSTVYVIVTGPNNSQSGAWEMNVEVDEAINAPTLTGLTAHRVAGERHDFRLQGADLDGDAEGLYVTYLDGAGAPIAVGGETTFFVGFAAPAGASFDTLAREDDADLLAGTASAARVRVTVVDRFDLESAPMEADLTTVTVADRDAACGPSAICADGLECIAAVCTTPAACASATPIAITIGSTLATASAMGTIEPGLGASQGTCSDTFGSELLYTLTIPAATAPVTGYDVLLDTSNATTGAADTVLYVQSTCADATTEVDCSDDIDDETYQSELELRDLAAGAYTIAVELYGGADASTVVGLDVAVRPVLAAGQTCDPAGVMNRCSTGACPTTGTAECPTP
ncbi:MAG: hypothetical protein IT378_20020 [Sandaracinaceae bacterium]|nr:hypothetical protein [Sandaracinaceae bacterium]